MTPPPESGAAALGGWRIPAIVVTVITALAGAATVQSTSAKDSASGLEKQVAGNDEKIYVLSRRLRDLEDKVESLSAMQDKLEPEPVPVVKKKRRKRRVAEEEIE